MRSLPVDVVKIDQSFIREIVDATAPVPVVSATIAMAHGLGLRVVAEGVETADQFQYLADKGCDVVQGYLLGRPMPTSTFAIGFTGAAGRMRRAPSQRPDYRGAMPMPPDRPDHVS